MAVAPIEQAWHLLQRGHPADALALARQVLAAEPSNISALACRAMAVWDLDGENPQSLSDMQRAVEMAPGAAALRHNFATLLVRAGRVDEAAMQYRAALELAPDDTQAFWGLATNARMENEAALVERMASLAQHGALPPLRRQFLAFGLAKAFDDLGRPAEAMAAAIEGNQLMGRSWNSTGADAIVQGIVDAAGSDRFRAARTSGHPSRAPLFIVGMPRSGTTLIETILSRHPSVLALGESRQIGEAMEALRGKFGPEEIGLSPSRDWLTARAEAMARSWAARRAGFALVTDKMPDNAFALGLIARLFPRARIIHARRHPLDVGVSNFFTRFADGQGFSTRLDWIGLRSRHLADVMDAWRRGLDLPVLDVHYERLVAEPEAEIRRIADFAGLGWTPDFLSSERSERSVGTASQWQVRQPIYRSSVARWRRYEPWLGPMIEAMGGMDWVEAQGPEMTIT